MLSDEQVEIIRAMIDQSKLNMQELKDDLLDHLCCVVEYEMQQGLPFEKAAQKAFVRVCPNGLEEIQRETIFLLNIHKILRMKKFMYVIGLLASITVSIGYLFILMQWPGGGKLFNYGFLGLVLIFLPMLAIDRYKLYINQVLTEKLKMILGFSSAFITGLAAIFKLLHLQGAGVLLVVGILLFAFGFLPFQFFRMYKKSLES
ncbi:MAG: hypothetical protein ACLFQ0_05755 [Cyclobacteriaceae bacterium]